ncbi:MAG TPA: hypothetical protein VG753_00380 [Candidatus Paceibacterota bacterium]|nr:hypothetical protein [Candidatus Paceibacterota bacterium]
MLFFSCNEEGAMAQDERTYQFSEKVRIGGGLEGLFLWPDPKDPGRDVVQIEVRKGSTVDAKTVSVPHVVIDSSRDATSAAQ